MSDYLPKMNLGPSVSKKTEIIEILKNAFAKDQISLEEYEKRIVFAENAKTIEEIETLTRDLPSIPINDYISTEHISETENLNCQMANKQFAGSYLLAKTINIEATMSTIKMDYRNLNQIKGLHEIKLKTEMTTIILFLPEQISVENRLNENMTTFKETKSNIDRTKDIDTIIRFIGDASMTTIKIKRQRRKSWLFGHRLDYQ